MHCVRKLINLTSVDIVHCTALHCVQFVNTSSFILRTLHYLNQCHSADFDEC